MDEQEWMGKDGWIMMDKHGWIGMNGWAWKDG
jgi:hypothetical protein